MSTISVAIVAGINRLYTCKVLVLKYSDVTEKQRCSGDIKCPKYMQVYTRHTSGGLNLYKGSNMDKESVIDGDDSPKANPINIGRKTSNIGGHSELA